MAPVIAVNGVVPANGSPHSAAVAPGSIVTIYGSNLASPPHGKGFRAAGIPLPHRLPSSDSSAGATQVLMNGIPAPLYYADSGQINAQVPWSLQGAGRVEVQVAYKGATSNTASLEIADTATLATFPLAEMFGVSWPSQPIEFRYDGDPVSQASARMLGPDGSEVPYQWVTSCSDSSATKGCIVVRSDLPANASYSWTLQAGVAASVPPGPNSVQVQRVGSNWEITNGLTGVRLITAEANPNPWNLAPLQGVQLSNGAWTGVGQSPNLLYAETASRPGCVGCALQTPMYTATGYSVTIGDSGPLKATITATYTFNHAQYANGTQLIGAAGPGHYTITATLFANSHSVLIDEDSDMQFAYYLPVYDQIHPDTARYRGHDSIGAQGVPDPACGYTSTVAVGSVAAGTPMIVTSTAAVTDNSLVTISGVQGIAAANGIYFARTGGYAAGQFALYLDSAMARPASGTGSYTGGGTFQPAYTGVGDAFLNLTYSSDRPALYACLSTATYAKLVTNYPPARHAAGWYTELYQSSGNGAGADAPVLGFYTGRFSKQIFSAVGPSMPGLYTSDKHFITGKTAAGIQVENLLRSPANTMAALIHRNWAIWAGTQASLLAPALHQPIADDQNALTGINLSRLYTYHLVYPDPPGGWTWLYLPADSANRIISLVRDGTSACGSSACYYNLLAGSDGSRWGQALLNLWRGNSTAAVQAALNGAVQLAQQVEQTLISGDNRFDGPFGYYQLGLSTSPQTVVLNAILMDSNSTAAQKASAKACLALFGSLFWDNDWWPIDNNSGESVGLANQIQQYLQYRSQSAAAAPSQPFLASMLPVALSYPLTDFGTYFSSTGAAAGSTHYQGAFFQPLILNYLNLSLDPLQSGVLSMADPKWAAYANWELSIQTPPEPRFGNLRKGYSNGDGNTEGDARLGMLGTALFSVNPQLSGNLMWAWQQNNSATHLTEDAQFVTTLAVIDPTLPAIPPQLSSINVPGYHSVERHNFGAAQETAVWFINGGFYSTGGHRHYDDGQVSIYALSAPLAIDWNANAGYPSTAGRFMHDSIVFDSELTHPWSADNAGLLDAATLLNNPVNTEFAAFSNSTTATGAFTTKDGTVWTRTVRTMAFNPSYPIIAVSDNFSGPSAGASKTLTWNLMASGPVDTPAGPVTPTPRLSGTACSSTAAQLPSNGTVFGLSAGLNEFSFQGMPWPQHATQGINWDLFTVAGSTGQQFYIGNWGHSCHASREMGEYAKANGSPFAEIQDILRIHDTGPFQTLILPYRKSEPPARTVSQQDCGLQVVQDGESTCFNDSAATYSNASGVAVLTVFDASKQRAFGITASGGPQEVVAQSDQIVWTISGVAAGTRSVTLPPGVWSPDSTVTGSLNQFSYAFSGGQQAAPVTVTFTLIAGGPGTRGSTSRRKP